MVEELDKWREAGKIASQVREYAKKLVKKGAKVLDVAEKIEKKIFDSGGEPAFPVNISFDDCAAHYTAAPEDELVFKENVVKIDVGVHIDGCVGGDTACTIDLSGKHGKLVEASEDALQEAIKAVKENKSLGEIGRAIQDTITGFGFSPVRNLSGHGLSEYDVHTVPTIPNVDTGDSRKIEKESFIAIEPFATYGKGEIYESGEAIIFSQIGKKGLRNPTTKEIFREIEKYNKLPFATRWLTSKFSPFRVKIALNELSRLNVIKGYPPLVERAHEIVSQAEHSLYIGDEVEILTK